MQVDVKKILNKIGSNYNWDYYPPLPKGEDVTAKQIEDAIENALFRYTVTPKLGRDAGEGGSRLVFIVQDLTKEKKLDLNISFALYTSSTNNNMTDKGPKKIAGDIDEVHKLKDNVSGVRQYSTKIAITEDGLGTLKRNNANVEFVFRISDAKEKGNTALVKKSSSFTIKREDLRKKEDPANFIRVQ